ncbi:phage holin family protein [Marinactinospora rubrisoli]|uniref:Phage holin family protein n=1 Tax=Marinactinospora rubrisoli TaxID=2715399 RepID=A0ABW2KAF0_9ACTN
MSETRSGGQAPVDGTDDDRSLGELVSDVSSDLTRLVRLEVELAKLEVSQEARKVATGTGLFVGAALLGHLVLILASVTVAFGLYALGLQLWLAFLIVTAGYILLAAGLVLVGQRYFKRLQGMPRTSATMASSIAALRRERPAAPGPAES